MTAFGPKTYMSESWPSSAPFTSVFVRPLDFEAIRRHSLHLPERARILTENEGGRAFNLMTKNPQQANANVMYI